MFVLLILLLLVAPAWAEDDFCGDVSPQELAQHVQPPGCAELPACCRGGLSAACDCGSHATVSATLVGSEVACTARPIIVQPAESTLRFELPRPARGVERRDAPPKPPPP